MKKLFNLTALGKNNNDKKHYILYKRMGIEEWEMMVRLQYFFSEEDAARIIRKAKIRTHELSDTYISNQFVVIWSEIYMSYSVFVLDQKFKKLVEDIPEIIHTQQPRTVRTFVEELQMYDGNNLNVSDVDYLMNCRLIAKRAEFEKTNSVSISELVWKLTRTLIDSQRENRSLKKSVTRLTLDKQRLKDAMKTMQEKEEDE